MREIFHSSKHVQEQDFCLCVYSYKQLCRLQICFVSLYRIQILIHWEVSPLKKIWITFLWSLWQTPKLANTCAAKAVQGDQGHHVMEQKPLTFLLLRGAYLRRGGQHTPLQVGNHRLESMVGCQINLMTYTPPKCSSSYWHRPQREIARWKIKNDKGMRFEENVCLRLGGISKSEGI